MNDSESDIVENLKRKLSQSVIERMEGTLNQHSIDDLRMFDELLLELLEAENIVLSRAERQRLRAELLAAFE